MADGTTDRATRFRGEGRPKRKLSPSPPPKAPVPKPSSAKRPVSKGNEMKETRSSVHKPTPPKRRLPTPSPEEVSEEEPEDESLPTQFKNGQRFPIVKERQPEDLPLRTYKSIAESGVLSSALEKSRQRWLMDGLFEKFWIKYSRKNKDEPAPSSQSMTKLNGECFMVIEPHSFKVTLFSVKASPTSSTAGGSAASQASPTGPPPAFYNRGTPGPRQTSAHGSATPASVAPPSQQSQTPVSNRTEHRPTPPAPAIASQLPRAEPMKTESPSLPVDSGEKKDVPTTEQAAKAAAPATQATRPESGNNADPVIQMLAARAATDNELKSLMKIVAQGQASQEQLSVFQRHIDELNGIIQAQKKQGTTAPSTKAAQPTSFHPPPAQPPPAIPTVSMVPPVPPHITPYSPHPFGQHVKQEPFTNFYHQNPAPIAKPKGPVPSKPVLSAIVFEFAEASGTRYLLPRNSILEYLPGNNQVLISFLIIRKGDEAVAGRHKEQQEYYQPVTVRLMADNAKLLEPLARVVAPQDEVRRQMAEVMDNIELAEDAYLATRLPRATENDAKGEDRKTMVPTDELKSHYEAPNSLLPIGPSCF